MRRHSTPSLEALMSDDNVCTDEFLRQIWGRFSAPSLPKLAGLEQLSQPQKQCLRRCLALIRDRRAVLLCEATGTGKTYVAAGLALAVKALSAMPCAVLAPAHLLPMWRQVLKRFDIDAQYFSYQSASLGKLDKNPNPNCLWLVDEAHMLKSTHTKRYQAFLKHSPQARLCLITASPISLGYDDLHALLKLCAYPAAAQYAPKQWLRISAESLIPQTYAQALTLDRLPQTHEHRLYYKLSRDTQSLEEFMQILLSITWIAGQNGEVIPKLPIIGHHLIDRLLSHRSACLISLKRLKRFYDASLNRGKLRLMSRKAFRQIFGLEGRQLPLPFDFEITDDERDMRSHFELTRQKITQCIHILETLCKEADDKVKAVQRFIDSLDPQRQIVLFTRYTDTAKHFAQMLKIGDPVALLSAKEARYGQTEISREALQALFDPDDKLCDKWEAQGLRRPRLLICSDAFSSGHNLQRAAVLIHIDKPWNPTTKLQRNGRIIRQKQKATSVILADIVLDQAPLTLLNFEEHWDLRRVMRRELQKTWLTDIDKTLQDMLKETAQCILFCPKLGVHGLWIAHHHRWLPIHPKHALAISKHCIKIRAISLAAACELSIPELKPYLKPLWTDIRKKRHSPSFAKLIDQNLELLIKMALLTQVENHLSSKEQLIKKRYRASDIYQALSTFKIPPSHTTCFILHTCPQKHA